METEPLNTGRASGSQRMPNPQSIVQHIAPADQQQLAQDNSRS
jgi:hypothetical protein